MFEQDLPGENKAGLNYQSASALPLESCITMNDSWGFRITDRNYKSVQQIIHTMVGAAGRNSNLLLNVGPMPNGLVQQEFQDTLKLVGDWMQRYGQSIYGTRGGPLQPQSWVVSTENHQNVFVHVLQKPEADILIPGNYTSVTSFDGKPIVFTQTGNGIRISKEAIVFLAPVSVLVVKKS
jgi:alpha-L-fucosidase